jgi:uncharacterized Zn finger protein
MWGYREYFPRSRPRAARGGIKAQSKRGQFGETWWAKRWIQVLESFDIGARLGRGRSYARSGQVLSVDVGEGEVTARVQGSRPKPYDITIQVKVLTAPEWRKVVEGLSGQALFTAKLLAGEMPQDIEKVFTEADLSLFPRKSADLKTSCSCPDWSNPCKHIAAVYYLLGEEFDRDPFLLFRLRGLTREELLKQIGRDKPVGQAAKPAEAGPEPAAGAAPPSEPLPADPARFWGGEQLPADFFGPVQTPPVPAGLVKRLGNFPFWRGNERFLDALEPIYRQAGWRGLELFLGDRAKQGK